MFKNYFKIAIRNLVKHRKYSLINILSLAVGLAGFILIMLWVQDELSYDRFHKNADDIYMVLRTENGKTSAITSKLLAPALKSEIPEIIDAIGFALLPESFKPFLQYHEKGFEESFALTDAHFFEFFSFPFLGGNPQTAFDDPNSIVLTRRMSQKYFGRQDALGESLTLTFLGQKRTMKVTGIIENIPHNSHIQRDFFIPIDFINQFGARWDEWYNYDVQSYVLTEDKINKSELESKILACEKRHTEDLDLGTTAYVLHPITRIHLYSNNLAFFTSTGDIKYIYIFSLFAGIILLIACMNYINLTNALSLKRTREIGIKKAVGAQRKDLLFQYYGETLVLTFIALGIALLIIELFLPVLNQLFGNSLSISYASPKFIITLILTTLLTSVVSGLYPAFFILRFKPTQILKGNFKTHSDGLNLQKGLVIFQFTLSIAIIICTVIVLNQMNFIRNTNLGYDKENVVCIKVKGDIFNDYQAFKNELLSNPNILNVCRSEPLDMKAIGSTEDVNWQGKNKRYVSWLLHVDPDFAATYKIEMKEGRFYSDQITSDETSAYVINEAAQKEMGLQSPIGAELKIWGRTGRIIGVTRDFNFGSLHHVIEPLVLRIPDPVQKNIYYREISIRVKPMAARESIAYLRKTWKSFFPSEPFNFYFFDESLNANYFAEQRMGTLFKYFSMLAIFIACFGLYGLTAFMIEAKVKDIGIRKVLGAEIFQIVFLLLKKYMIWIFISNVIAWPIAWYAMHKWLQNFAYRIDLTIWPFLLSGFLALLIALLTVSWQAMRAATANPVESLRYE
jgi:putative ABC transport system permease protein